MKKRIGLALKIIVGMVALLLVLLVAAMILLNTDMCQQKLLNYSVGLLEEKLQTKVKIDHVSLNIWTFDVELQGLCIEDQQARKMLQADHLSVSLNPMELLAHKIEISESEMRGVRACLHHPKDSAANYQFAIDAFKSNRAPQNEDKSNEELKKDEKKRGLAFDIHRLQMANVDIEHHWVTKKGYQQTDRYSLSALKLTTKRSKQLVTIDSLRWVTDNHQPRKNANRPYRGAFDMGHLDVTAHLTLVVNHIGKDTANVTLAKCVAADPTSGFHVNDLHFDAGINKTTANLTHVVIRQGSTELSFDSATIQLPNKKAGRKLAYQTSPISGKVLLKDIAKTFAPPLNRFSIPLELKVTLSGTDSTMQFKDIHVNTLNQALQITAKGDITHLRDKEKLKIRFHVNKMTTNGLTAKRIIDQFTVKKYMMRQLVNLGSISYTGDFDILHKKERFRGLLSTSAGKIDFNFTIDGTTKYIHGQVHTNSVRLGKVLEMKDIGEVACRANFSFDISKQRTAIVRKQRGGKLPIGSVDASEIYTNYKKIKLKDLDVTLKSDGVIAKGQISRKRKFIDLLCNFSFTHTDSIQKMRIMPGIKLHRRSKSKR